MAESHVRPQALEPEVPVIEPLSQLGLPQETAHPKYHGFSRIGEFGLGPPIRSQSATIAPNIACTHVAHSLSMDGRHFRHDSLNFSEQGHCG